jgi:ferredoxin
VSADDATGAAAPALKVRAHPGLCEGWGNCHRWAPEVYPLDDVGHIAIHLLAVPDELAAAAWAGAQVCPARAITVDGPRPDSTTPGGCGP